MTRIQKSLAALAVLATTTSAAPAQSGQEYCRTIAFDLEFCPDGTEWDGRVNRAELSDDGKSIKDMHLFQEGLTLEFSLIPEAHLGDLPWWPKYRHAEEMVSQYGDLMEVYFKAPVIDRFAPLGEDTAAASVATYDPQSGWVSVVTYYIVDGAELVIQTGDRQNTDLTDHHRSLHIAAVRILHESKK